MRISKGKSRAFCARSAPQIFGGFQGQIVVLDTFLARSAKKILRVFKGKVRFLAPFRAKREKILGYPEGSQIGTPETPPPSLRGDLVDKGGSVSVSTDLLHLERR